FAGCLAAVLVLAGRLSAAEPPREAAPVAENPAAPPPHTGKLSLKTHPTLVTVIEGRGGRKTLAIEYRWKVHAGASVEVRLVPADRAEGTFVTPLDFVGEYLKSSSPPKAAEADLQRKIYHCLDRAGDEGLTETFEKDKMAFRIVGRRNSLGRGAVSVLAYPVGKTPEERADIVFLELSSWAVADDRLNLDLPPEVFAKRGTLFVWFLRGNRLLWEEQVGWK
ncbi:MAG: hypothetical protein ABR915_17590, partial [Thermoguttaceae bacterium]